MKQQIGVAEHGIDPAQIHYTNPATDVLNITVTQPNLEHPVIQLFDLTGKMLHQHELTADGALFRASLQTSDLPTGVYLIELRTANGWRAVVKLNKI